MKRYLLVILSLVLCCGICFAQSERKSVRRGNRQFKKEQYAGAEIDYKKALVADSTSVTADYNLGNNYYRMENYPEADRYYKAGIDSLAKGSHGADAFHNMGNSQLKQRNWQAAIEAYKNALRNNPNDDETRYNLVLCKHMKKKQDEKQKQNQQNQDDQNKKDDQKKDDKKDQKQDKKEDKQQEQQKPQMSKDNAEQLLNAAIQNEKMTQDKMKKAQQQPQRRAVQKNW